VLLPFLASRYIWKMVQHLSIPNTMKLWLGTRTKWSLVTYFRLLPGEWERHIASMEHASESLQCRVITRESVQRGRPPFIVAKEQLEYFHFHGPTYHCCWVFPGWHCLGDVKNLECWMNQEGNWVIHNLLLEIKNTLPGVGEQLILGRLKSMGYRVTRTCVRDTCT